MTARLQWPAADALWAPGSGRLTRRPGRSPALLVLPSSRSPRLLVPTGVPAAGQMVRRHSTTRRQRLAQAALARSVSAGLLPLLPVRRIVSSRGDALASVEGYVRAHLPEADAVGVLLGPPRANAKPVLRVFDKSGRTIAYGKVGHNVLTAELVRHESAVLAELAHRALVHVEPPAVLHTGRWRDVEILLLGPLAPGRDTRPSWQAPLAAMYEVAELDDELPGQVGESAYLADLRARAADLPTVAELLRRVVDQTADVELHYGRWHGDWAPWNMGGGSTRVPLWEWERSSRGVPRGFDIAHFVMQHQFRDGASPSLAAAALLESTGPALQRWYPRPDQVSATVLLYLCEILARYAADCGPATSPSLRHRIATIETVLLLVTDGRIPKETHVDA